MPAEYEFQKFVNFLGCPVVHGSHPPDAWHPRNAVANVVRNPPRKERLADRFGRSSNYPKAPWDVIFGVKLPPVLRPFSGCHERRVVCVSIGGVRSLRVVTCNALNWGTLIPRPCPANVHPTRRFGIDSI